MKLPRRNFLHLAAGAAALPTLSRIARAQAYPSQPVRIIVGLPAGTATDILARFVGQSLSERLGKQFIVENRPGAAGNIATEVVMRASPDGYTLLQVNSGNAVNASLYANLNFNFIRDITPVASSWWLIHHRRPKRSPSSSPMPRLIRERSIWPRPASAARTISSAHRSR